VTYAVLADMQKRFDESELIQLTDEAALGVVDGTAMTTALVEADNTINLYLSQVYTLPIAPEQLIVGAMQILVDKACDIARYRLYRTPPSEQVEKRYKEAIAWLEQIAAGRLKLMIAGGAEVTTRDEVISIEAAGPAADLRDALRRF
jgi:phage gp36-like protein